MDFGRFFRGFLVIISKSAILRKLAFRLDGTTIFKVSKGYKSNKKRPKIEAKLRPKNARQKNRKKRDKREKKERKKRGKLEKKLRKKESKKKKEKREAGPGTLKSRSSGLPV